MRLQSDLIHVIDPEIFIIFTLPEGGEAPDLQFAPDGVNVAVKQEGALDVQPTISGTLFLFATFFCRLSICFIQNQCFQSIFHEL